MIVEMVFSGTPDQIKAAVASETKQLGRNDPLVWPFVVSLRDYIGRYLDSLGAEYVGVNVNVSIAIGPLTPPSLQSVVEKKSKPKAIGKDS